MKAGDRTRAGILAWMKRRGSRRNVEGMARYGIVTPRAFGISMAPLRRLAKEIGKDHALAAELWASGWLEARVLASFIDDPREVTRAQMDAWSGDFDNWAVCDTVCLHLFTRTPHAWGRARVWARSRREYVKRAGFTLMACLAGHDKAAPEERFLALLPRIEVGAQDERNYVKKAVSWALRRTGTRSRALRVAAIETAARLTRSERPSCRWVGRDALRDLTRRRP